MYVFQHSHTQEQAALECHIIDTQILVVSQYT